MSVLVFLLALQWEAYRGGGYQPIGDGGVLTTDGAPGRFSDGEVRGSTRVRIPYQLDVTWRRLGPETGRSMHVLVADGVLLVRDHKISLYAYDESAFAALGWTQVPGLRAHELQHLTVTQDRREVRVEHGGAVVARFALPVTRDEAEVGLGFKGAGGFRSRMHVHAYGVRELQ